MLYTEDFTMRHYVGFSQIGSHMCICTVHACIGMYIRTCNYKHITIAVVEFPNY